MKKTIILSLTMLLIFSLSSMEKKNLIQEIEKAPNAEAFHKQKEKRGILLRKDKTRGEDEESLKFYHSLQNDYKAHIALCSGGLLSLIFLTISIIDHNNPDERIVENIINLVSSYYH